MVTTKGRIKAGTFVGPKLEHYTSTGSLDFTNAVSAQNFFDLISASAASSPAIPKAQIALIGELKTAGNPQRFALYAGSGWTAALLASYTGQTVVEVTY